MAWFEEDFQSLFQTDAPFLAPLFSQLTASEGKRLRPVLFLLSQGLIRPPRRDSLKIALILELLHTATLIHDDVVDASPLRRGQETFQKRWGAKVAVLLGDYLFARVLKLAVDCGDFRVLETVSTVVQRIGEGELRQMLQSPDPLSVPDYLNTIHDKTATLFEAAARLGGLSAQATASQLDALATLGASFGMAFQIQDDCLDWTGDPGTTGKPAGLDIANGQITLPLILALKQASEEDRAPLLHQIEKDELASGAALTRFIRQNRGFELARQVAAEFAEKAEIALSVFPDSEYKSALSQLLVYNSERAQ